MSEAKDELLDIFERPAPKKLGDDHYQIVSKCPPPVGFTQLQKIKSTYGNSASLGKRPGAALSTQQQQALIAKKQNKAMALAISPAKQMGMNALMLWFSGSQLNMFSINTTTSAILTPLTGLLTMGTVFGGLDIDTRLAKIGYVLLNLLWLGVGLYKMSSMRLLPTTSADWTSKLVWKEMMEATSVPPPGMPFLDQ